MKKFVLGFLWSVCVVFAITGTNSYAYTGKDNLAESSDGTGGKGNSDCAPQKKTVLLPYTS